MTNEPKSEWLLLSCGHRHYRYGPLATIQLGQRQWCPSCCNHDATIREIIPYWRKLP